MDQLPTSISASDYAYISLNIDASFIGLCSLMSVRNITNNILSLIVDLFIGCRLRSLLSISVCMHACMRNIGGWVMMINDGFQFKPDYRLVYLPTTYL